MSIFRGDASEIYALAADMGEVTAKMVPALRSAMAQAGESFADVWADNARDTLTQRGKRGESHAWGYPDSIDSELVFNAAGVSVDVGPNEAKKHGFLGNILENGGEHSPPYLHGLHALDYIGPEVENLVAAVIGGTFVGTPAANESELKAYVTKAGVTRMATQAQIDNWTRGRG